ncbi:MAG: class II D-tagatose-bisphosphate aldolase non-catalytic subunit [Chloroflexota bacterium]
MYLDEIVAAQKRGEAKGIASICSAHPFVIQQTLKVSKTFRVSPLIEATCNQVNQFGGYTGMTPKDFAAYVRGLAEENGCPVGNILLGGDHLGPSAWQDELAESAMQKAEVLIRDYVQAGFTKIHLDCSMKLADDPPGALDVELTAKRAAQLAKVAESVGTGLAPVQSSAPVQLPRYVIGTEVPIPGGAIGHEEGVSVTKVEDARQTLEVTREAFYRAGLQSAWERVIALVVQPGVEFGDDFVLPYQPEPARALSEFIESQPVVFEAHSTDYQARQALKNLVRDHFAILKVGPALTFAFREAVFALAMMENELFPPQERSNIISVLGDVMLEQPGHWAKYYHGDVREQAFKRKYSLSDRIRYYWTDPRVQRAFEKMMRALGENPLPAMLVGQFAPDVFASNKDGGNRFTPGQVLAVKIENVLDDYVQACNL